MQVINDPENKNEFLHLKIDCPCPKIKCERWGYCDACEVYHDKKGKLPCCKRNTKKK